MKKYNKPQMMAKNAPTGSYAAGCPTYNSQNGIGSTCDCGVGNPKTKNCKTCEVAR